MARPESSASDVVAESVDPARKVGDAKPRRKSQFTRTNALIIFAFFFSVSVIVYGLYFVMVIWIPAWFPPPEQSPYEFPYFTYVDEDGAVAGEPINLVILADEGQQIVAAFEKAGLIELHAVIQESVVEVVEGAVVKRVTPISTRYVLGRAQDYGFQSPSDSLAHRHHLRVWRYDEHTWDGKPIWLVSASYDHGLGLAFSGFVPVPTHIVSPNIDDERDFIADLLGNHKIISQRAHAPGVGPYLLRSNGDWSFYFTDGNVVVVKLEEPPDGKVEVKPLHWSMLVRSNFFDVPTVILQFLGLAHAYESPAAILTVIEEGL